MTHRSSGDVLSWVKVRTTQQQSPRTTYVTTTFRIFRGPNHKRRHTGQAPRIAIKTVVLTVDTTTTAVGGLCHPVVVVVIRRPQHFTPVSYTHLTLPTIYSV